MKVIALLAAVAGLAMAGAAVAQDQVSDAAFLKANRCKGLAVGLGADVAPFKAYLRNQGRSRADMVLFKASGDAGQAQREAANPANKDRLTAELAGPCSAYGAPAKAATASASHPVNGASL
jgi:hypothetical protein